MMMVVVTVNDTMRGPMRMSLCSMSLPVDVLLPVVGDNGNVNVVMLVKEVMPADSRHLSLSLYVEPVRVRRHVAWQLKTGLKVDKRLDMAHLRGTPLK